jgi:putative transposase
MSRYRRSHTAGGTFFFTVALARRNESLLVDHIGMLRESYQATVRALPFRTLAICVLPEHLHCIWELPEGDRDFSSRWSRIKSGFSRSLPAIDRSESKRAKREKGIWQRRLWEHEIRNAADLQRHVDYIHYNPVKHRLVARVADWEFSSFHRYVREELLSQDRAGSDEQGGDFGERGGMG